MYPKISAKEGVAYLLVHRFDFQANQRRCAKCKISKFLSVGGHHHGSPGSTEPKAGLVLFLVLVFRSRNQPGLHHRKNSELGCGHTEESLAAVAYLTHCRIGNTVVLKMVSFFCTNKSIQTGSVLIIFNIKQFPFERSFMIVFRVSDGGGTNSILGRSGISCSAAFRGDSSFGKILFCACFSFGGKEGKIFCPYITLIVVSFVNSDSRNVDTRPVFGCASAGRHDKFLSSGRCAIDDLITGRRLFIALPLFQKPKRGLYHLIW